MTRTEFIQKAKDTFGRRGKRDAISFLSEIDEAICHPEMIPYDAAVLEQSLMTVWFHSKAEARRKFTPKQYRNVS